MAGARWQAYPEGESKEDVMKPSAIPGRLSFSIGETLLSSWEAARLAPGEIVLTSRQAGYPGFVLFNNLPLGLGEVVVLDQTLAVRLVDTDFRPSFLVDPGRVDTLGEMVPSWVDLGGFDVDLEALTSLGPDSFVNLGVHRTDTSNAILWFAGVPLARGTVVVVGELMGLRITERLLTLPVPPLVRQSGNLADRVSAAQAKDYDFSRPDKWSRNQLRRIEEVHRLFQRNLEASLPEVARRLGAGGLLVDQCTLGEARELLAGWDLPSRWTWEHGAQRRSRPMAPGLPVQVFEAPDCALPLTAATRRFLGDLASSRGQVNRRPVFLHAGPWLTDGVALVTDCLRTGWKRLVDFRLDEAEAPSVDLPDHEMVLLVVLRSAEGVPALALVYPFLTVEPYANVLGS